MIRLEGIDRIFQVGDQQVHALSQVDLEVGTGEYISIMGPSGSGKSTLLNLLGLLDRPTSGRYFLNDQDVSGLDDARQAYTRRRYIGFVFQFFHLVPRLTAAGNVELPLILDGVAPAERHERVKTSLAEVGLADRAHHRPDQLSGGQRQRVAIARATIMRPQLLLADEPTGNLDQASGADVLKVLEALSDQGIALMVVTHDANIGARAHRAIRMVDGRIVSDRAQ
ncbi:MAG: ABC transporter ATP-binding protein [Gammaproteobacteria bacterium]|nr:ABC transporter ATP-binding protein [Gammaproteobacteria bacterium]